MEMWPALAPQVPHCPGSSYFHTQERAFFSRDNSFFRVQINIDSAPCTNQALGSPYRQEKGKARADVPQLSPIPRHHQPPPQQQQQPSPFPSRWSISPPSQHRSPGEQQRTQVPSQLTKQHRSWPIPINPLPASPSLTNNHHVDQYQVTGHNSQYPYPPPELRHKSPTMIDDDAWLRPTPHSERRRVRKVSRRKAN